MNRLRIALVIPTMDGGGAEKQLSLLATGLPADRFNVHVYLLTRGGVRLPSLRQSGVPVTIIGKRFQGDLTSLWRLRRHLRSFGPDIVHTWIFAANAFGRAASLGLRRSDGRPVVIVGSERCVDPWKRSWQLRIDRFLAKHSRAITTNSHGVVEFYRNHGIAPEKFRVIANGIEPPTANHQRGRSDADRSEVAAAFGIDADRHWIVSIGRLWPQKRYRDLIWAAELIGELRRDTTLIIVGDGPQRSELLRHRDAVTRDTRVRLVGHRTDADRLLQHAAVYWNGSQYEGQSNSVLEAMRHGVPVVATDIAGNRDLIVDGQTGRLVKLGDTADFARQTAILLADANLATAMSSAAIARVAGEFSMDRMVAEHAELYRQLCR